MSSVNILRAKDTKLISEETFRTKGKSRVSATTAAIMDVVRRLWPEKTDWALRAKTGASDRACRYWLENKYNLSSDALAKLLRTNSGFLFLEAIMESRAPGEPLPAYWLDFKRGVLRGELRRRQEELAKALDDVG
jgi:hypothetical protein